MNTNRLHVSSFFWLATGWPVRIILMLALLSSGALVPAATPAHATGTECTTSGPSSGAYTVTLCFTSPADGDTLTGNQTVTATVTVTGTNPPTPGGKLFFYLDGQYILTDYQSPYTFTLPTARWVDGTRMLEVEAQMKDGFLTARASLNVTFSNGVTTPPVNTNTRGSVSGTTPPAGQAFVVAVAGDGAGGEATETGVTNLIASWNPNLVFYVGDVYEQGTPTEFYNWYGSGADFYSRFRAITNPAIGNHEYSSGGGAAGYFDYWDNIPHYYSDNVAGWHVIVLDSTSQFGQTSITSPQYLWLANDLSNNSAACTVAYWHHPAYSVGPSDDDTARVQNLWKLLANNGVDLLLTGHDHDYQRWTPLDANGTPAANGTTEFVVGTGGHAIQSFIRSDTRLLMGFDTSPSTYGALRLELNQNGAAFRFVNKDGVVLDSGSVPCSGAPADTTAPSAPTNLAASSSSATRVDLTWTAATDDVGVTGYDVYRNGSLLASIGSEPSYSDTNVAVGTSYSYQVKARDAAGQISDFSNTATVTTPSVVFADGFESGDFTNWDAGATLTAQQADVFNGSWAARATSTATTDLAKFARKTLNPTMTDVYYRAWFKMISHGVNSTDILRFRTSANGTILSVFVSSNDKLGYRNDVTGGSTTDANTAVSQGNWHSLQAHVVINGTNSQFEVWLDGVQNTAFTTTQSLGTNPVGIVQLGEPQANRIYDVILDEAAVNTQFIPTSDAPPAAPTNLRMTANSGGHVDLAWDGVTDPDLAGYEVYRNGSPLATLGNVTSYSDSVINPSTTYQYQVRARDTAGNLSAPSNTLLVTTPADTTPPSVTLTGPSADAILRGSVTLSADATDDVAVSHVDFLVNGTVVGDSDEAPYSLTWDSATVPDGPATVAAIAVDAAGNATTTPNRSVIIDNTLPDTVIDSGPSGTVNSSTASFSFSSTEAGSTFACSLDGGAFSACTSPKTYTGLADGAHTFQVAATDAAGNVDATPASQNWTIDTTAVTLVSDGFESGSLSPTWTNQGNGLVVQQQQVLEGAYAARATSSGPASWAYTQLSPARSDLYYRTWFKIISQGTNNVNLLRFRTSTGGAILGVFVSSTGKLGYVNDTTNGQTTSTTSVSQGAWHELQVHVVINGAAGQVEVWLDSTPISALSKTENLGATTVGRLQLGESQTGRTYDVAFDEVVARSSLIASSTTPFTIIDSGPSGIVSSTSASFSFSSTAPNATFECDLDGVGFSACASPQGYTNLTDGAHTFQVRATDAASNTDPTPASRTWTVDTTAPTVTSVSPADSATGVDVATNVVAVFSEGMDSTTLTTSSFTLVDQSSQTAVAATLSYDAATKTATLHPTANLASNVTYLATVKGGVGGAADLAGNPLAADMVWSFTTAAPDTTPPTAPTELTATAVGSGRIDLTWTASTDDVGVTAYDVYRDGALLVSLGNVISYSDTTAGPATTYSYQVKARDAASNVSDPSNTATAATPASLFSDRFESGDLSRWTSVSGLVVQQPEVFAGVYAARATSTAGPATYAYTQLTSTQSDLYYRIWFKIISQGANSVHLLRFRTATGGAILEAFVSSTGKLGYRNDVASAQTTSTTSVSGGVWHELQAHVVINGGSGQTEVWLDGTKITDLSKTENLGTTPVGRIQLGDDASGATYDVAFDDVTVANAFINSGDIQPPDAPTVLTATSSASTQVDLGWNAAADNVGVTGYNVYRDGALLVSLGSVTGYSDLSVTPMTTYQYQVRARDAAENISDPSNLATVTTLGDTTLPSVALTAPADGAVVKGSVALSADATDDVAVDHVDFLVNDTLVGTDSTAPYSISWNSISLADGPATITARAVDTSVNAASASHTVTVDNTPPDTTIDSGPSGYATSNSATFSFSSNEPGSTFACSLDFVSFSSCTSPQSYTSLPDGTHTFQVQATDSVGNTDATPASRTWTVDTVAPTVTSTAPADGATGVVIMANVDAVFSEAMDASTLTASSFTMVKQGTTTPIAATVSYDATTNKATLHPTTSLEYLTTYTATVKGGAGGAADLAGNPLAADKVWSFTTYADTFPPETTINSGPPNPTNSKTATFSFSSNEANSTFACSLDGAAFKPCNSPKFYNKISDGAHAFAVQATDVVGNTDPTPATWNWTVDTVAPTVTSVAPADGATGVAVTTNVDAVFSEAMDVNTLTTSSFTLVKQGTTTPIAATVSYNAATRTATLHPTASLQEGTSYSATVKGGASGAKDLAGNPLAVDKVWSFTTVRSDTIPPTVTLTAPPDSITIKGNVALSADATDNIAVDHVDFLVNGTVVGTDSTAPYSINWNSATMADGPATITARAVDTSSNTTTSASRTVTVDNTAPDTTMTAGPSGSVNSTTASFSFTATETGATFACSLDGAAFSACNSPQSYTGLANGSHTFQVRATDAAGNTDPTPASRTWTIDTVAPTVSLTAPANGAILNGPVKVSASANDNVGVVTVRFYLDGQLLGTDTTSPYEINWNTNKSTKGSHTLYAVAGDAAGNATQSVSITVTVR